MNIFMLVKTVLCSLIIFVFIKGFVCRVYVIEPVNNLFSLFPSNGKIYDYSNYQYFLSQFLNDLYKVPYYQILGRKVYINGELIYESPVNTVPNIVDGRIYVNGVLVYDPYSKNRFLRNCKSFTNTLKRNNSYTVRNGKVYIKGVFVYQAPPYAFVTVDDGNVYLDGKVVYDRENETEESKEMVLRDKPLKSTNPNIYDLLPSKIIEVKNGQILINQKLVYDGVRDLMADYPKELRSENGKFFINDKVILKENPTKNKLKLPMIRWRIEGVQYSEVSEFRLKTCKNGTIRYIDNKINVNIFE